jgi:hypothetical protein
MAYALIGMMVVSGIQAVLLWQAIRRLNRLERMDARLGHLTEALALLTETTEAGLRANAQELTRVGDGLRKPEAPARRVAAAASRRTGSAVGKPRTKTAAPAAQMSEGEMHLRLHLAENGVTSRTKGGLGAALRA